MKPFTNVHVHTHKLANHAPNASLLFFFLQAIADKATLRLSIVRSPFDDFKIMRLYTQSHTRTPLA
jgi:hypothetical protein